MRAAGNRGPSFYDGLASFPILRPPRLRGGGDRREAGVGGGAPAYPLLNGLRQ